MKLCWFMVAMLMGSCWVLAQQNSTSLKNDRPDFTLDMSYFYGSIPVHNPDIAHLITGHPRGVILRYNKPTYGKKEWQARYNYPDWGVSFAYQDLINPSLGHAYSVYAHYNFYFLNRKLQWGLGTGLAYMTNPYDPVTNFRNIAHGTKLSASSYIMLNYQHDHLIKNLGFKMGLTLMHYSNANFKEPNASTNSVVVNAGVVYHFGNKNVAYKHWSKEKKSYPIGVQFILRHGWNESDIIGSGQFPFFTLSTYLDKRISYKSSLYAGIDFMHTGFLKEYRDFQANSFPESGLTGDESVLRIGAVIGHELHLGKMSLITALGYYVFDEIEYASSVYNRIGLQQYIDDHWSVNGTLKFHGFSAEGVSLGIGYRL